MATQKFEKVIIMILSQYEMSLLQQLNQHPPLVHSWQKAAMALQKPVNAETRCQKAIVLLIIRFTRINGIVDYTFKRVQSKLNAN